MKLSVIIPAYNEEPRIGKTLDIMGEYLSSQPYQSEVIVVDDGSRDRTGEVVREKEKTYKNLRLVENDCNRGKGYTVRHGVSLAKGEIVLFFDADSSTPIDQVEKFWPEFDSGKSVCIGSRSLPESNVEVHQPWFRENMGRIFNLFVRVIAIRGFVDTQCGFKAFTCEAAKVIFERQTLSGFGFDVELLFIAKKHGFSIVEVPIKWIDSPESRVHPIRDATKMFLELISIRYRDLTGSYR